MDADKVWPTEGLHPYGDDWLRRNTGGGLRLRRNAKNVGKGHGAVVAAVMYWPCGARANWLHAWPFC